MISFYVAGGFHPEVWSFDPAQLSWNTLPGIATSVGLQSTKSFLKDNKIYFTDGNLPGYSQNNDVFVYDHMDSANPWTIARPAAPPTDAKCNSVKLFLL